MNSKVYLLINAFKLIALTRRTFSFPSRDGCAAAGAFMDNKLGRLTFETIRVVYHVLKKRNMTLVSNELGMTQPAVTFHVRKFENIFGRKIINRVGNNLIASGDSQHVIEICEGILNKGSELEFFTSKKWDKRKALGICPDVFAVMAAQHPNIFDFFGRYQLVVDHPSSLADRFNSGELHAVFRSIDPMEMRPDLVMDVSFLWVASSRLRQVHRNTDHLPIILDARRSVGAVLARRSLETAGAVYRIVAEVSDFEALRVLVEAGAGYALVPRFRAEYLDVEPEIEEPLLSSRVRGAFGVFYHKREVALNEATDIFDGIASVLISEGSLA
jgi:DNA-binding transcriptional LysR family regulator